VEQDPIFDFPLGKSRFRAFNLPTGLPEKINFAVRAINPFTNVFANGNHGPHTFTKQLLI